MNQSFLKNLKAKALDQKREYRYLEKNETELTSLSASNTLISTSSIGSGATPSSAMMSNSNEVCRQNLTLSQYDFSSNRATGSSIRTVLCNIFLRLIA
jgi:hypothetical protein